jgi:hypothetical protein
VGDPRGWRDQALAIFLTYTSIVSSYVPYVIESAREAALTSQQADSSNAAALTKDSVAFTKDSTTAAAAGEPIKVRGLGFVIAIVFLIGFLYALPFLAGLENIIGILIIGFALYEAWKLNRKVELQVSGPHQVATSGAPA